jgi:AcrR family transcriptional regulator
MLSERGAGNLETQDRRIRRTQKLLAKALIQVTIEKGYDAVTVRDITDRADVGYATFYRHYQDKDALLEDVLEVVLNELVGLLSPDIDQSAEPGKLGAILFGYVKDHYEIIRVLLSSRYTSVIGKRMIEDSTKKMLNLHVPKPDSLIPPEIAAYHLISSSINLIEWWLVEDMRYSPEQMGLIYYELIEKPTIMLAFNPVKGERRK